jgi:RNA 3'-terminal phosphate cyclase (ATP)
MIEIDGSLKSGSGTILRDAVSFAVLVGQELRLTRIRARRKKPGLRPQHLKAVEACAELCGGRFEGGKVGSDAITFHPGQVLRGGNFTWNIGTAGSTTMLAMTLLPLALFAGKPSVHTIVGGLFQDFAPSAFHFKHVLLPVLRQMGADAELEILQPGYVPHGQGRIRLSASPLQQPLLPLRLTDSGRVQEIRGIALASRLSERRVAERMAEECRRELERAGFTAGVEILEDSPQQPAFERAAAQAGAALALWARTSTGCLLGADMAGAPRRSSEFIGRRTARSLVEDLQSAAAADRHLADQVIPYAALAEGSSELIIPRATDHIESRIWLVQDILGAEARLEDRWMTVRGIGRRREQG